MLGDFPWGRTICGVHARSFCHLPLKRTETSQVKRPPGHPARYARALVVRAGDSTSALTAEVLNQRDSGARLRVMLWWRPYAVSRCVRTFRTIGLILNGADPCT
jgi:hypothetical protein